MKLLKLPKMIPGKECQELVAWIDNLEIGEVKELRALKEKFSKAIEKLTEVEKFIDEHLAVIPADSRQRELPEETWEHAMYLRDSIHNLKKDSEETAQHASSCADGEK